MKKILSIIAIIATLLPSVTFAQTIFPNRGGTGITSYTAGDLIYASSGSQFSKLGIGDPGECLKVGVGVPYWDTCGGGGTWGSITGTLSDQTDLQNALNSKLGTSLLSGRIFVGNASNVATGVALSGDATINNSGSLTVANDAITFGKIQNISADKLLGRTGSSGDITEITVGTGLSFSASTLASTSASDGSEGYVQYANGIGGFYSDPSFNYDQPSTTLNVNNIAISTLNGSTPVTGLGNANEVALWDAGGSELTSNSSLYVNGLSQLEAIDSNFLLTNKDEPTKQVYFDLGDISALTIRQKLFQDTNGTLAELGNKLSAFASTTSAELAGVISDETGTGALVFADTPTFTTRINVPDIRATSSGGFLLEASNGTDIGLLGAGNTANVTWYGSHIFDTLTASKVAILGGTKNLISDTGSDLTVSGTAVSVVSASTTTAGKVELAIDSEVNTGTSTTLAVTPDALAGSYAGSKELVVNVLERNYTVTTGDRKACVTIPSTMNGMNIVEVGANVYTTSSSGTPTIQIARGRQASATSAHSFVDVLSTRITIDATEYDSKDATTAPVINTSNDDLATGDLICGDIDVTGTGTKGLSFRVVARLP